MKDDVKKNQNQNKLPKPAIWFAHLVFIAGVLFSILVISLSVYRVYSVKDSWSSSYYISIFVALICIFLFGLGFRLRDSIKVNLALLLFTVFFPIYTMEAYFEFKPKSYIEMIQKKAEKMGLPFDKKTQIEVLSDLRKDGIEAYPAINPKLILDTNPNGLKAKGKMIFPLGTISNKITSACNEWGYRLIYESDEYGFNNPKNMYQKDTVDIVLTGDSYADGYCVKPNENIGAVLRKSGFKAISIGKAGNGSLLEFAALKEYAEPIQPKIVLWLHFENDLSDLQNELKSSFLMKYLSEDGFRQNLISSQVEIDHILINYIKGREQAWTQKKEKSLLYSRPTRIVKLTNIRGKISLLFKPKPDISLSTDTFKTILEKAKRMVYSWNGRLYFVYLPVFYRYTVDKGTHPVPGMKYRNDVLSIAGKLDIPIIDIHKEVFATHPDPLSLFPFRTFGHYNEEGFKLVSETIARRLNEEN